MLQPVSVGSKILSDLSSPNSVTLERPLPYLDEYPAAVFHMDQYVLYGLAQIIPPAIEPLAPKNMAFSTDDVSICGRFGVDMDRPLLCQASRFDPWKDPLGVIDAYRIVEDVQPDVQPALAGARAAADPEGRDYDNAFTQLVPA